MRDWLARRGPRLQVSRTAERERAEVVRLVATIQFDGFFDRGQAQRDAPACQASPSISMFVVIVSPNSAAASVLAAIRVRLLSAVLAERGEYLLVSSHGRDWK